MVNMFDRSDKSNRYIDEVQKNEDISALEEIGKKDEEKGNHQSAAFQFQLAADLSNDSNQKRKYIRMALFSLSKEYLQTVNKIALDPLSASKLEFRKVKEVENTINHLVDVLEKGNQCLKEARRSNLD
jgi:hypothetical protein